MHQTQLQVPASARQACSSRLAFFDVDETLIAGKSMLDFLHSAPDSLWGPLHADAPAQTRGTAGLEMLAGLAERKASRAEMNRAYYELYAGVRLSELQAAGRDWYATFASRPAPYVTAGIAALAQHRRAGHTVVLVSGSAHPFVDPVAEALGAELVLCTELEVDEKDVLTGSVTRSMIGTDKARAVSELSKRLGVAAEECFAYGDHASDLAMLQAVGTAVVVGTDPVLLRHAQRQNWSALSGTTGRWTPEGAKAQAHRGT
ncbi:HAD family hydrolase [Streptomyces sp. NPDC102282]|uniref:HAD family hydrolase n=1 Tax=Streptomyces sp. NPDC102282 TaxID=3366154 RepID=UPI0038199DD4